MSLTGIEHKTFECKEKAIPGPLAYQDSEICIGYDTYVTPDPIIEINVSWLSLKELSWAENEEC